MGAADASFGFAAKRTLASGADAHFKTTGGGACELAHVSVSSNKKKCLGCESIDLRWNIKTRFIKLSIPQNHPDPQTLTFPYSELIFSDYFRRRQADHVDRIQRTQARLRGAQVRHGPRVLPLKQALFLDFVIYCLIKSTLQNYTLLRLKKWCYRLWFRLCLSH